MSKVKLIHHDRTKHYQSRESLDNTWVLGQVQHWEPTEVPPPNLEEDSGDFDLGVQDLFSAAPSSIPTVTDPGFVPSCTSHVNHENGGGAVEYSPPPGPPVQQSRCRALDRHGA